MLIATNQIFFIKFVCFIKKVVLEEDKDRKGFGRWLGRAAVMILAAWALCIIVIEIILSTPLATSTVNRIASQYIDGSISFGKVSASVLRHFPAVTVNLEDFCITYPSDRFDEEEKRGPQGRLMYVGNGEQADTLASFSRFTASLNITPLLFGKIAIPEVILEEPEIYVHSYEDGKANWNIIQMGTEDDTEDTSDTALPDISLGKISLIGGSRIVYTDSRDTVFALIELRKAGFDGRLRTRKTVRNRIGLAVNSMLVAGRIAEDTLALGLDRLHIHEHDDHMDVDIQAKTTIATRAFGRMNVPVNMGGTLHFPEDSVFAVGVHNFRAEIAAIPFKGEADLRFHPDRTSIEGDLTVEECKVDDILKKFVRNFIPEVSEIKTDAVIGLNATCKGDYIHKTGKLPVFSIDILMPHATVAHKGLGEKVEVALDAFLANTRQGRMNINVNEIILKTDGLDLNGYGGMLDILSDNPTISIDGKISASLDSLARFIPDSLNLTAEGRIAAEISGKARMSDLSLYTFSQSSLTGKLASRHIFVKMPDDSLDVTIENLGIDLGPESRVSRRDSTQTLRLMGVTGKIEKIAAAYKGGLSLDGKGITLSAKNSADNADTSHVRRLSGRLSAEKLAMSDAAGTSINLDETSNGIMMMPKRDNPQVPVMSLTSTNKRITLATDVNRAILTDASFKARATMNTVERRQRLRHLRDSLSKVYPDVPEDSLLPMMRSRRQTAELPAWLKEEDFRKQDIDIRLDQSLAKYFRDWDLDGKLEVRTGIVMTPYFPLRNILRGMNIAFTNDRIAIDSMKVMAGKSGISAKGELTGLRRALIGSSRNRPSRSTLNLDLDISTEGMNANEILTAYNYGTHFNPEAAKDKMADASNSEFLKMVISDTASVEEEAKLIVIPGNVNADICINGKNIAYSDLNIYTLDASLLMKERCVQITNTMATSNIGDVSFEGFYATRTKEDIKAGFNFEFKDITAEKALDLMPAVDTVIPLLKSFAGKLNCELAATASLDTNMNILPPTINGVMRISGDDLTITDSDLFTSIAKKLKFQDSQTGKIGHMMVEGVIKDNVLEVFPFVLKLDLYTLAMSGKQNLDMSYRYHASIIKSPMVIRVGVDVYGEDFDHMKFKIGKPKYKSAKVPVFTTVIDQTRINLASSIRNIFEKGVEAAVQENERQEAIKSRQEEIGYVNAVDQESEELSEEIQKKFIEPTENQQNNE